MLRAVGAHAEKTLATAESRTLPAAGLRNALSSGGATGSTSVPSDLVAAGAETYASVLAGVQALAGSPGATKALAEASTTIPLLPATYKKALVDAVADAQRRRLAPAPELERLVGAVTAIPSDADGTVAAAPPTRMVDRLLVRVYPDDIAVDTHEPELTEAELSAGKAYWTAWLAATGEADRRAAWRALCAGRGSNRAAFIAQVLQPRTTRAPAGVARGQQVLQALTTLERRIEEVSKATPGARVESLLGAVQTMRKALEGKSVLQKATVDTVRARWTGLRASLERLDADAVRRGPPPDARARRVGTQLGNELKRIERRLGHLPVSHTPALDVPESLTEGRCVDACSAVGCSAGPLARRCGQRRSRGARRRRKPRRRRPEAERRPESR